MQEVPQFIVDKQESSARGAARLALALIHAHHPELDLEHCTASAPEGCDSAAVFAQVQGLDNRVVRMVDHGTFYDKEPLTPVNLKKERARLRREEAARRKEAEDAGMEEVQEHQSEEAKQSEEKSNPAPTDGAATPEDSDATSSSPSAQVSPTKTVSQEE